MIIISQATSKFYGSIKIKFGLKFFESSKITTSGINVDHVNLIHELILFYFQNSNIDKKNHCPSKLLRLNLLLKQIYYAKYYYLN